MRKATAPTVESVSGPTNGTVILKATLFRILDNSVVPGKSLTFLPLKGRISGGSFITNDSGEATCTVSLVGVAPTTSSYTVQFLGDPAEDVDGFDSSESDPGDLVVTEAEAPPVVPDPPKIGQPTDPTLSKSVVPPSVVAPSNASDVDPYTGQRNPSPYSGVSNIDPFTGAPKADAFTGVPTSQADASVQSFINKVFSQPPVDFSGIPQSIQDRIIQTYSQDPVDYSSIPQSVQNSILDIYNRPAIDFSGYGSEFDYAPQPERLAGPLESTIAGVQSGIHAFTDSVQLATNSLRQIFGRVGGGVQAIGGVVQVVEGVGFAIGTAETGIGIGAGLAYAANGLDNAYTGFQRAMGEQTETLTYSAVESVTGSSKFATAVDIGIPLAGGVGISKALSVGEDLGKLGGSVSEGASSAEALAEQRFWSGGPLTEAELDAAIDNISRSNPRYRIPVSVGEEAGRTSLDDLAPVSRWGRSGLEPGDWIVPGDPTRGTYLRSFKWDPLPTNEFAPRSTGQAFMVPEKSVQWPTGWGPDGAIKGLFGQRKYVPPGFDEP